MNINFLPVNQQQKAPVDPAQIAYNEAIARALKERATESREIEHPMQGVAQLSDALFGGLVDQKVQASAATNNKFLSEALAGATSRQSLSPEKMQQIFALNPELGMKLVEMEQARADKEAARNKPIEINGQLIDPATGKVVGDYRNPGDSGVQPVVVNGQLINPQTGELVGDYRSPDQRGTAPIVVNDQLVNPQSAKVLGDYRSPEGFTLSPGQTRFEGQQPVANIPQDQFRTLSAEEKQAIPGLDPSKAYQIGPDNKVYEIGGNGVKVEVDMGGAPELGKLSTDFGYVLDPATGKPVIDPATGLPKAAAVPGSPAAIEAEQVAAKMEGREGQSLVTSDTIISEAQKARDLIGPTTTGAAGWALNNLGFTDAADLYRNVGALKSIAASENLQQMRANSPTGGALGNASDADIKLLQDKAGALDPASPRFPEQLDDYERTLLRIVHGPEAGDQIFGESRPKQNAGSSGEASRPQTQEDYDAIPSGALFIDPDDGQTYRKP